MAELNTVLCDGYDRDVFARVLRSEKPLREVAEKTNRILPHGETLLCDLFCSLYKLNVVIRDPSEISAAVLVNRRLVEAVVKGGGVHALRQRTQLDERNAAAALTVLAERLLKVLMGEYRIGPESLVDMAEVAEDEDALVEREAELEHLEELPEDAFDEAEQEQLKEGLEQEINSLKEEIDKARKKQVELAKNLSTEIEDAADFKMRQLPKQMDEVSEQLKNLGLSAGHEGRVGAARRMELGERLMRSKKLQLLARLVGAFREVAFEARRKRVVRAPQELHAVRMGSELERLLPSELLGVGRSRPGLHLEFLRRYTEGQLLQYQLQASSSRGPMVVCVDGSGSMHGSKELWAKAVGLTLMEIARREKRRCLAIVFSSANELLSVELLGSMERSGGRATVRDEEVLRFAEYFPGGGTDFEAPLKKAMDAVAAGTYRRGDIVFVTDGEAHVSDGLLNQLNEARRKHRFKVRGILIDVGHNTTETLERFCDDVRRVSDLTADAMTDLFSAV